MRGVAFLCAVFGVLAQETVEVFKLGPDVTPPKLVKKSEPKFSKQAEEVGLEGTVILEVVVTDKGVPSQLRVVRPLGYGLDEEAMAAVKKWRFAPGEKAGRPVNVLATIEVNFRWLDRPAPRIDGRLERFMPAYRVLEQGNADTAAREEAVRTILGLSEAGLPEAQFVAGTWKLKGQPKLAIAADSAVGLALLRKSAAARYGPAMYVLAKRGVEGEDGPADVSAAMKQMHEAAGRGSPQAQYFLGTRYEEGNGVAQDAGKAEFYFRQCAYDRVPQCQYRLGKLLLGSSATRERDRVPAIAYLELAGAGGVAEARALGADGRAKLTAEDVETLEKLKPTLVRE
ncbi:MAG: TonB family protein [Bryobacterales bacterium]|nr:TonB family protein [Bryobacterales bacterium]